MSNIKHSLFFGACKITQCLSIMILLMARGSFGGEISMFWASFTSQYDKGTRKKEARNPVQIVEISPKPIRSSRTLHRVVW